MADAEVEQVIDQTKLPELPARTLRVTMGADIDIVDGQLKVAHSRGFEFFCDEPPQIGGEDRYPQPLTYVAAGVGF